MTTQVCPFCKETCNAEALRCPHCQKDIGLEAETIRAVKGVALGAGTALAGATGSTLGCGVTGCLLILFTPILVIALLLLGVMLF